MLQGWIKIYRSFADKGFYKKDSERVHLWLHLLLMAAHHGREEMLGGKPITLLPGQLTTTRAQLSEQTGISVSKIERILNYFEKIEQQIVQQTTTTNRLISIINWRRFQVDKQQYEQQPDNDRTATEQRSDNNRTYLNNNKNTNNEIKSSIGDSFESPFTDQNERDLIVLLLDEFCEAYRQVHNANFEIITPAKERSAIEKLLNHYRKKFPDANTDEILSGLRSYFYKACAIADKWLYRNMSPSLLLSKFNEITNTIQNEPGSINYAEFERAANEFANQSNQRYANRKNGDACTS